jgi:hypothetical protein
MTLLPVPGGALAPATALAVLRPILLGMLAQVSLLALAFLWGTTAPQLA